MIQQLALQFDQPYEAIFMKLQENDRDDPVVIAYKIELDNMNPDEAYNKGDFYLAQSPPRDTGPIASLSTSKPSPHAATNSPAPTSAPRLHPERMPSIEVSSTGTHTAVPTSSTPAKPHSNRRGKWHLGIRSQSRPQDIMAEVYKALKTLNFEWKIFNPYHIHVRRCNPLTKTWVYMGLQLYQVDKKSYLLDFKSLSPDICRSSSGSLPVGPTLSGNSNTPTAAMAVASHESTPSTSSSDGAVGSPIGATPDSGLYPQLGGVPGATPRRSDSLLSGIGGNEAEPMPPQHQTIEFFELCSSLIASLAG